ncbi:zinc-binding alcohol dehydrogenase [Paenibacillus sp.]|uniref:zinc-dependent alcohol dehydrogenase n=1 Tax=Paenibacillus sp. TaxID=58172 RepID=UPI002D72E082|nr:zinc-binding alcohol dehydrogenase [Paenibacillus sp.]HZG87723.1 zinc-binding alcohol dehydrogenase [Paenibacillus sp.]
MKAIATRDGAIEIVDLAPPERLPGRVLVRVEYSAVSPGTEMSFVRSRPAEPVVLGYSAVGIVEEVCDGVAGRSVGERVACYGAPYARHAELLSMPANLTAPVPAGVDPREAAFGGLGAIAVHALRTAGLAFGESAVVVGLGILGNLIAQIGAAAAFRIAGVDVAPERADALGRLGVPHAYASAEALEARLADAVGPNGADAVFVCAAGPGGALIDRAMSWLRDRGKIVVVGDVTTEFSRSLMFAKEAQVLISRAGGPGRYDPSYERDNRDYPIGYVRWTEGRNLAEYIRLLAEGRIRVAPLLAGDVPLARAADAYAADRSAAAIGTLIRYPYADEADREAARTASCAPGGGKAVPSE